MSYERTTPKDLVEAINMPQGEDMTRILGYIQRLWELENAIEQEKLVSAFPILTDFEKYLGKWLLQSGEDCCARCAYCFPVGVDNICDNLKREEGLDDEVCLKGLKEYAKKHAGQK